MEGAVSAIWEQPKWAEGKVLLPVALSCAPECRLPESPPPQAALGEGARERAALGAGERESPVQGDGGASPNSSRLDFLQGCPAPAHKASLYSGHAFWVTPGLTQPRTWPQCDSLWEGYFWF